MSKLRVLSFLLIATAAAVVPHASAAQSAVPDSTAIDVYVRPYVQSNNFSGQILVRRGGRVVFQKVYGEADRGRKIANTSATSMHIASMSMQFTAAAIMRLIDMGKLTLDTRVATIVPTVRGGDAITIRNLLEERSGLSDINQRSDYAEILGRHQTPASLVAIIGQDTLLFTPGSKRLHEEHSAYNLLALIIEKKTGVPFSLALQRLVFDPLHMTRAGADDDAVVASANIARGYDPDGIVGLKPTTPIHWSAKSGNASIYLSASDEAKWIDALFKGQFLSPASRSVIVDSTGPAAGYGWFRGPNKRFGEFGYQSSGRSPGFASFAVYLPRSDLTVVVLSNIYSSATATIGNDIAAIVLGKPYTPFAAGPPLTQAELQVLDGLAFTFGSDFYQPNATLSFDVRGETLFLHWPPGDLTPMIPLDRDHFVDRAYWQPVVVEHDSAGHPIAVTYDRFRGGAVHGGAISPP